MRSLEERKRSGTLSLGGRGTFGAWRKGSRSGCGMRGRRSGGSGYERFGSIM